MIHAAEAAELPPGPIEMEILPDHPFGTEARSFIDAALGINAVEQRKSYGVLKRVFTWSLPDINPQQRMIDRLHLIPEDNSVILDGTHVTSYPISDEVSGSSGEIRYTRLVAEKLSGTVSVYYTAKANGQDVDMVLDIHRTGQIRRHEPILHITPGETIKDLNGSTIVIYDLEERSQ